MKLVLISDTHGQHRGLSLPEGDMIIHAGDISRSGDSAEVMEFLQWYADLDYKHKIFVAGNHDYFFEDLDPESFQFILPDDVTYLNDSGIEIEGKNIWGSPVQPWFYDWAFNRRRGGDIQKHWDLIPKSADILITHGPPFGVLDRTTGGLNVGCEDLTETMSRLDVRLHVFGHIHEAYGVRQSGKTTYVNASVLDHRYRLVNPPVELEF